MLVGEGGRETGVAQGHDGVALVGDERDLDPAGAGRHIWGTESGLPAEGGHDALVRDEPHVLAEHDRSAAHLDPAGAAGARVEMGCGAPPVAHSLSIGPVPPHRLGSGVDAKRLFHATRVVLGHRCSFAFVGRRSRVPCGHSSRSAAALSPRVQHALISHAPSRDRISSDSRPGPITPRGRPARRSACRVVRGPRSRGARARPSSAARPASGSRRGPGPRACSPA